MRPPPPTVTRAPHKFERPGPVLLAVAAGGAVGALARHGLTEALPPVPHGIPWTTFAINTTGCLLIGILMPMTSELRREWRLLRPFLGAGALGGFTTFSTYALDAQQAITAGAPGIAVLYTGGTALGALAAVFAGASAARRMVRRS